MAVRHLRKAGAENPIYRGGGSIGIIGAARAGLLVARDPDDPTGERRIIAATKSNLGPLPPSLAFTVALRPGEPHPHIAWQGETTHRAADLLAQVEEGERGASDDAEAFLRERLAAAPVPAREVQREARAAGIAPRTLERAKSRLHVKSIRPDGFTGPWFWTLSSRTSPMNAVPRHLSLLATYRATWRCTRPTRPGLTAQATLPAAPRWQRTRSQRGVAWPIPALGTSRAYGLMAPSTAGPVTHEPARYGRQSGQAR